MSNKNKYINYINKLKKGKRKEIEKDESKMHNVIFVQRYKIICIFSSIEYKANKIFILITPLEFHV